METRRELCLLSCLLWLVCELAAQAPQELKKTNDCIDQKTCGDCLAAGPPCGWCFQEKYSHPERCDIVKNLIPNGCDDTYIINPVSGSNFTKDIPPRNAEEGRDPIQLSPQEVKIKLRPNEPYKFQVSFRQAENYPVDLYYVMDLSNSMEDDKAKLAELGDLLASKMSNITKNFRLGFGSFVDKKTMPYVSTVPDKLISPCTGCAAPYGFLNKLKLTENTAMFRTEVIGAPISGNLDSPEGGFDAIMQAIACNNEIGWRNQSRKLLLFSTDAGFHYAGDGKLGGIVTPNDGHCHLNSEGEYTESLYQDYPSISQLAHKVAAMKVNVIFAVTENQINVYRNLSAFIEGSTVGMLANDSSNIVELVKDNYDNISSSIELKTVDAEDIIVQFKTKCLGHEERDVAKCEKIGIAQNVTFEVSVMVTSCPSDRSQWNRTFRIYPVGLTENLEVHLELQCECNCEKPEFEEKNSPKCNSSGTYECGACTCNPGRYGRHCECDGSQLGSADYDAQCKMTNTSKVCEGRGQCLCGKCDCQAISSSNTSRRYSGAYCECNNYNCDYSHDDLCGGPTRGVCKCGKCECIKDVWNGSACECPVSQAACLAKDGSVCNNKGECKCGVCDCNKDVTYKGPTCEECPTCPGECEQKKPCVQCKAYENYKHISKEDCEANCTHVEVVLELGHNEDPDNWKTCKFRDDDDCDAVFEYHYNSNSVKAMATKECPTPVNILAIVLGVIGGIILIGLLLLLIWKLLVTIHDRREYARFEKERENARWDMGENPIYKQATSTYKNPTYANKN